MVEHKYHTHKIKLCFTILHCIHHTDHQKTHKNIFSYSQNYIYNYNWINLYQLDV